MKFSTRKVLVGKVTVVELGTVNAEIGLELAGCVTLHAVITKASVQGMGLEIGDTAAALFKASNVILAVKAQ